MNTIHAEATEPTEVTVEVTFIQNRGIIGIRRECFTGKSFIECVRLANGYRIGHKSEALTMTEAKVIG